MPPKYQRFDFGATTGRSARRELAQLRPVPTWSLRSGLDEAV